ncbi:MAG TPA: aldose epimerase family protein [Spirochaetales bacterium]|nr:aldose epimerase family protein [Spirochaetales bacterium]HRZ63839.1 aldose epimerase family protein [Spirochaetia bacterium]
MSITKLPFGTLSSGEEVSLYRLAAGDFVATISDYGASLLSILLPEGRGAWVDVLVGPASLAGLLANRPYFGASVGRVANRIARGRFSLGGRDYQLAANDGGQHLHGGLKGFDKRLWSAEGYEEGGLPRLALKLLSPDGEEGYPGELEVEARFGLSASGELEVAYEARSGAASPVNLTNHAYFNLAGEGRGDILGHRLRLLASSYLKTGPDLIPTGEVAPVAGSPYDFRAAKLVGADIALAEGGAAGAGYDHCYVLDRQGPGLFRFAELEDPRSGRRMAVSTTLPAVQFYSGNFLNGEAGKRGSIYGRHAGLCLETQFYPDAPNQPSFPSIILEPGKLWSHRTVFAFEP